MAGFKVMSWNVENLFQPGGEVSPGKVMQVSEYEAKLEYLTGVISDVAPDVLALQELGGDEAAVEKSLTDLSNRLPDGYPHLAMSNHPDGRSIRVAFLSKQPIVERDDVVAFADGELSQVANWASRPPVKRLGRGALRIDVEPAQGVRVRLVTLHLKSKLITYLSNGDFTRFSPTDENERAIGAGLALLRRTAEAATVRIYLNDLMTAGGGVHTVVLGDLNDEPKAATSQLLVGPEEKDVTSQDKGDTARLHNLMAALPRRGGMENDKWFLPEGERFTRIYEGQGELIDHIYVIKGLLGETKDLKADQWRVREVRSLVDGIRGESVGNNAGARVGKEQPDHAPVYASFDL